MPLKLSLAPLAFGERDGQRRGSTKPQIPGHGLISEVGSGVGLIEMSADAHRGIQILMHDIQPWLSCPEDTTNRRLYLAM
jgi:hypothetical protein